MSSISKIMASLLVIYSCTPQNKQEEAPNTPIPLFHASPEEAHPSCATEAIYCNFYSDYGPLFVFKCRNAENKHRIYVLETTSYKDTLFKKKRWYESRLQQDVNNQTFSEYCKNTFENYKQFMQETE